MNLPLGRFRGDPALVGIALDPMGLPRASMPPFAPLPSPASVPLVGHEPEQQVLQEALRAAREGKGSTWVLEGSAGIGKTRLARWMEEGARSLGFRVLEGICLKEAVTPFFPFLQVLQDLEGSPEPSPDESDYRPRVLPSLVLFEEERPLQLLRTVERWSASTPSLVVSRDPPSTLRKLAPGLAREVQLLRLAQTGGPDTVHPGNVEALGELLSRHLGGSPGRLVALAGLEYLASQVGQVGLLRLVQFLRDAAQESAGHVLLSVRPSALEVLDLARLEAEGEVVRAAPPGRSGPPRTTPETPGSTLMSYVDALEAESRRGPLLILVDDLQWADPDSLRMFQFLARDDPGLPIVLVATRRVADPGTDPQVSEGAGLGELLDGLVREGLVSKLSLRPLGEGEALDLLGRFLGGTVVRSKAAEALLKRAGGNPYFLVSLARLLAEERWLRSTTEGLVLEIPAEEERVLPRSIRQSVVRRLALLARPDRELLHAAALMGQEFPVSPLGPTLGRSEEEVRVALQRLERDHRLLTSHPPGGTLWEFTHPLTWEGVRGEVPAAEARATSRRLAEWWERHHPEDVEALARLTRETGEASQAEPWIRRALDRAVEDRKVDLAERYFGWFLEVRRQEGATPEECVRESLPVTDRLRDLCGPSSPLRNMLELLRPMAPPGPARWGIDARLAYHGTYRAAEADAILERLLAEIQSSGLPPPADVVGIIAQARANKLSYQGRWEEALAEARRSAEQFRALGDLQHVAYALYREAFVLLQMGQAHEAEALLPDVIRAAGEHPLASTALALASFRSYLAEYQGDLPRYLFWLGEFREGCRSTGNFLNLSTSAIAMGETLLTIGDLEGAPRLLEEGHRLAQRIGYTRGQGLYRYALGALCYHQGDLPRAQEELTRSLDLLTGTEHLSARFLRSEIRSLGLAPQASLRELEELSREVSTFLPRDRIGFLLLRARLHHETGHDDEAGRDLEEALAKAGRNPLEVARVKARLSDLRAAQGDATAARGLREEAEGMLAPCGLMPRGQAWVLDRAATRWSPRSVSPPPAPARAPPEP